MNEITTMYHDMGISPEVYAYGEATIARLKERFDKIDQVAEFNQAKVLAAFRKNRVSATCFAASTGYGYNDEGRDKLEQVYADVFHTEAALVRPHITCGTHALTLALSANLLPGDELLSPVGLPYDTLQEVIGIRPSPCSLAEYGVTYNQVDLLEDGSFDKHSAGDFRPWLGKEKARSYEKDLDTLEWAGVMNQYYASIVKPDKTSGNNSLYSAPAMFPLQVSGDKTECVEVALGMPDFSLSGKTEGMMGGQKSFAFVRVKLLFCPMNPAGAYAKGGGCQHQIANDQTAVLLPGAYAGVCQNDADSGCAVEGIHVRIAHDGGIHSTKLFSGFRILHNHNFSSLTAHAAGSIGACQKNFLQMGLFYLFCFIGAAASALQHGFDELVHNSNLL